MECSIRNYPPIHNTLELAQKTFIINEEAALFLCPNSINFSGNYAYYQHKIIVPGINLDTGFCNYEETADLTYGNYTWTETIGGKTVSTKCAFKQNFNVTRKCLNHEDGWGDIDFTACRSSK